MIERFIDAWARNCLRFRKSILLLIAAISAIALYALPQVRFDNALEIWFLEGDPAILAHNEIVETFGSDETIIIGLEAPDVFDKTVLETVDRITRAVEQAPHVEKVFSLTNIESITGKDDSLEIGELVKFPIEEDALPTLRKKTLANQLYVGNVVSAAGDFTCIIARIPHYLDDFDYKVEAVTAIREILATEAPRQFFLSGGPVLDERFFHISEHDSQVTTTAMLLLLAATLWLLLRSVSGMLVCLGTVATATVWAIAWVVLCGARVNMITTILPPLLLAVGVAGAMHVLVEYQERCARGEEKRQALRTVYCELMTPLFLTSFTTAIGMLSLTVSKIAGIREFGIFAALGVAGAFFLSVTLVPIVLSYLPAPKLRSRVNGGRIISPEALEHLYRFTLNHGKSIAIVSALLVAAGAAAATQLRAESAFLEYFKDSERAKIDTRRIEEALAGTITLELIIDSGRPGGIKDPQVLAQIAKLQRFMEDDPHITSTQSITDYMKDLRRAFFANDQREYRLPESREEAAQYLLLYEMDAPDGDIREFVTYDYSRARLSARVDITSSNIAVASIARTKKYIDENFSGGLKAEITGFAALYATMEEYMRSSLIRGFSTAFLAIFVVFCLQTRSLALGSI